MRLLDSTSLIDRVLGRFGYEKSQVVKPAVQAVVDEVAEIAPLAHRASKASFDYAKAERSDMSFHYGCDEDTYHYAIGKDDWIPVSIAAMLLGKRLKEARQLIQVYADSQLWLRPESDVFLEWWETNAAPFERIATLDFDVPLYATDVPLEMDWPAKFSRMAPLEVSYQYRRCWKRVYVDMTEDFLAVSPVHADLGRLPALRDVETGLRNLLTTLDQFSMTWFEARGFKVDWELGLVQVEGYEALFYCSVQAY
ncbi:hypothetical protein [Cupriavidus nantongensis]|uniref:Uncharacterized protein n=1 Tax=Cupriavidus nantongensis TaxID=1796606 RepID=A0A142JIN7_9BURK|nr:hypothetical protein [Cupriavidus nantongensis]AMR77949.1 hypothetical protein A2G96_09460 [Cupriavidus nantongensis]